MLNRLFEKTRTSEKQMSDGNTKLELRAPRHTFPSRRWIHTADLLSILISRDVLLRYKRSFLGIAWSLLNPLAQLLVFNFVFRYVLPLNIENYASFLFTGLLAWNWFQTSLVSGTGAIVDNRDLVKRPGFSTLVLPVVSVATNFVHFLISQPVLLIFLILSGIPIRGPALLLPGIFAVQFLLTVGLVYFAAAIYVTFRDTQYLLGIVLMLGFYLSPVLYDASAVPDGYRWLYDLNPLAILIGAYRSVLLAGELPAGRDLIYLAIFSSLLVWAGYRLFERMSYRFIEEL
jgi:lipopolysaccharide transport system permease protein